MDEQDGNGGMTRVNAFLVRFEARRVRRSARLIPLNDAAKLFAAIAEPRLLTPFDLDRIAQLGFAVEVDGTAATAVRSGMEQLQAVRAVRQTKANEAADGRSS